MLKLFEPYYTTNENIAQFGESILSTLALASDSVLFGSLVANSSTPLVQSFNRMYQMTADHYPAISKHLELIIRNSKALRPRDKPPKEKNDNQGDKKLDQTSLIEREILQRKMFEAQVAVHDVRAANGKLTTDPVTQSKITADYSKLPQAQLEEQLKENHKKGVVNKELENEAKKRSVIEKEKQDLAQKDAQESAQRDRLIQERMKLVEEKQKAEQEAMEMLKNTLNQGGNQPGAVGTTANPALGAAGVAGGQAKAVNPNVNGIKKPDEISLGGGEEGDEEGEGEGEGEVEYEEEGEGEGEGEVEYEEAGEGEGEGEAEYEEEGEGEYEEGEEEGEDAPNVPNPGAGGKPTAPPAAPTGANPNIQPPKPK